MEIDRINRPERLLPSGAMTVDEAWRLAAAASVTGIAVALPLGVIEPLIVFFSQAGILLYSMRLKRLPLLGNLTVSFFTGFVFIYAGIAIGNPAGGLFPALFAFLINLMRELVKDIEDLEGDSAEGVFTFPARYGTGTTKTVILAAGILLLAAAALAHYFAVYNELFILLIIILVLPSLLYFAERLRKAASPADYRKLSNLLKAVMVAGLAAIAAGVITL